MFPNYINEILFLLVFLISPFHSELNCNMFEDDDYYTRQGGCYVTSATGACEWTVQIYLKDDFECSGGVIDDHFILTARHCVNQSEQIHYKLYVGWTFNDLKNANFIKNIHEIRTGADLILIETKFPIKRPFESTVEWPRISELAWNSIDRNGNFYLCGAGNIPGEYPRPKLAKIIEITLKVWQRSSDYAKEGEFIARPTCGGFTGFACKGDSGSILYQQNQGVVIPVGVFSKGDNSCVCNYSSTVYTFVNITAEDAIRIRINELIFAFQNIKANNGQHKESLHIFHILWIFVAWRTLAF